MSRPGKMPANGEQLIVLYLAAAAFLVLATLLTLAGFSPDPAPVADHMRFLAGVARDGINGAYLS